jgi:hypothetical protein
MKDSFNLTMLGAEFISPINSVKVMITPTVSWQLLSPSSIALSIVALLVTIRSIKHVFFPRKKDDFLSALPIVGLSDSWFRWTKATCLSVVRTKDWAFEGYNKVSY